MSEIAWVGAHDGGSVTSDNTHYFGLGFNRGPGNMAVTSSGDVVVTHRVADVTVSRLFAHVSAVRSGTPYSTMVLVIGGSDTSLALTFSAGVADYSDVTNTATLTTGSTYYMKQITDGVSSSQTTAGISALFTTAGQSLHPFCAQSSSLTQAANLTRYNPIAGNLQANATRTQVDTRAPVGGSFTNFLVRCKTAQTVSAAVCRVVIDGSNGNNTVTLTSSATDYEDVTHTDTVTAGQKICYSTVTGVTAVGTLDVTHMGTYFQPGTANTTFMANAMSTSVTTTAGTTTYYPPFGRPVSSSTETNMQGIAPTGGTASNLGVNITGGSGDAAHIFSFRKNGSTQAMVVSLTSTAWVTDVTNTVSISSGDLVDFISNGGTTGTATIRSWSWEFTAAIPPITGSVTVTEASDTIAAASTLLITGVLGVTEAGDTLVAVLDNQSTLSGTLTVSEASDTVVATGMLLIKGAVSKTEQGDTLVAYQTIEAFPFVQKVIMFC